jgi:hypothetical protein
MRILSSLCVSSVVLRHRGSFFFKFKYRCSYTRAKLDSRIPTCAFRVGGLLGQITSSVEGSPTYTRFTFGSINLRQWGCFAHLQQQCHNSKLRIFQEKRLKVLKCYNFLWVQRRHDCSPAASFANCVMTLYLLKVHLQTFISIPITKKMPNFELWHCCRKWAICGRFQPPSKRSEQELANVSSEP